MAIVKTIVRVGVSSSVRHDDGDIVVYAMRMVCETPTIFLSPFFVGARQFWVARRSLGFSLGFYAVW